MFRETKTAVAFVLLVLAGALPAHAEGGVHTQSVLMCGEPFDIYSGTVSVGFCNPLDAKGKAFPLSASDSATVQTKASGSVTVSNCQPPKKNLLYQTCKAGVPVCGKGAESSDVYVVPIRIDYSGGQKFFYDKQSLLVTCAVPERDTANREVNGAIPKCLASDWFDYPPMDKGSGAGLSKFASCVMMARADYAGNGFSNTAQGVYVHVENASDARHLGDRCKGLQGACFEATWGELGVVCQAHQRTKKANPVLVSLREEEKQLKAELESISKHPRPGVDVLRLQYVAELRRRLGTVMARIVEFERAIRISKKPWACFSGRPTEILNRSKKDDVHPDCDASDYDFPSCQGDGTPGDYPDGT